MAVNQAAELATLVRSVAHGLVVVANDGLGDEGSKVILRVPADTLDGKGNMSSTHGVITNTDIRADEIRLLLG